MLRLYLIRHAEPRSTWGDGDADPGLSDKGRAQADAARDGLLALPEALRPTRVVSSPLRRCRETAEPFAQAIGAELVIDPAIGEIPAPAALSETEKGPWLRNAFEGRWSEIRGDIDYVEWRRSVVDALAGYQGAAVFSHYVAINAALSYAAGQDEVHHARPDHASIHTFDVLADGSLTLVEQGREAATQVLV